MKRTMIALLAMLALCLCAAAAEGILGQPFPDFTVTDTQGEAFTLSEALQDHEAVLINIWATWCPPCEAEMPYLNEAYARYKDRVAFIALSCEPEDTAEIIEAYRRAHGIDFPMGRDTASLSRYLGAGSIPQTVIVDRFGNAAFLHIGSFFTAKEVRRVVDAFLGEGYTETALLTEIPKDTATRAFPVSDVTAIYVENEGMKPIIIRAKGVPEPQPAYVVSDDTALLRLEAAASDDPASLILYNASLSAFFEYPDLMDPQRGGFYYSLSMSGAEADQHYAYVCLVGGGSDAGEILYGVYLIAGEEYIGELTAEMQSWGYDVTWEYGEAGPAKSAAPKAYILHILDQESAPVPGVAVKFCTDTACTLLQSDENGRISFDGPPDAYQVQLLKTPKGYSFDPGFEMTTDPAYGEWVLRIRKD